MHHPLHGVCLTGGILMMPSSRGSCTGSGVLLDLILTGRAPAALVFSEAEDVLTLGALIAAEMFGKPLPVLRLAPESFAACRAPKQRGLPRLDRGQWCDASHHAATAHDARSHQH